MNKICSFKIGNESVYEHENIPECFVWQTVKIRFAYRDAKSLTTQGMYTSRKRLFKTELLRYQGTRKCINNGALKGLESVTTSLVL